MDASNQSTEVKTHQRHLGQCMGLLVGSGEAFPGSKLRVDQAPRGSGLFAQPMFQPCLSFVALGGSFSLASAL